MRIQWAILGLCLLSQPGWGKPKAKAWASIRYEVVEKGGDPRQALGEVMEGQDVPLEFLEVVQKNPELKRFDGPNVKEVLIHGLKKKEIDHVHARCTITRMDKGLMWFLNLQERTYREMPIGEALGMAITLAKGSKGSGNFIDQALHGASLEVTDQRKMVAGLPARKIVWTSESTYMGRWLTLKVPKAYKDYSEAEAKLHRRLGITKEAKSLLPESARSLSKQERKLLTQGWEVESLMKFQMKTPFTKSYTANVTSHIHNISYNPIPASEFEIPRGFRKEEEGAPNLGVRSE